MFDRLHVHVVKFALAALGCVLACAPGSAADGPTIAGTGAVTGTVTALKAVHGRAGLSAQRREGRDLHGLHLGRQVSGDQSLSRRV